MTNNRNEIDDDDCVVIGDRKYRKAQKGGGIVKDGECVVRPMILMDAASLGIAETTERAIADAALPQPLHRPGQIGISDALADTREQLRDDRKRRLSDAWRNPPAPLDAAAVANAQTTSPAAPDSEARYAARDARLENAWKVEA